MLVDRKGTLRILDLGLARLDNAVDLQRSELTGSGQVMGTVDYMSPEQAADSRAADARSDIYSLGCTLYRCLTGAVPCPRDSLVNTVLAHREAAVPRAGQRREDVPPALDELCAAMIGQDASGASTDDAGGDRAAGGSDDCFLAIASHRIAARRTVW
jgi:eukaryotic-like serine/threonine-protein kinase